MNRRWKLLLLRGSLFVPLCLAVAWPIGAHYRAVARLKNFRTGLKAKGEKLELSELVPVMPPESENGANALTSAAGRLPTLAASNFPPAMRLLTPGHALLAWRQEILPTEEVSNAWPGTRAVIDAKAAELEQIRASLAKPSLACKLDYSEGFRMVLPGLVQWRSAAQWLSAGTILELHEGRPDQAMTNLLALSALAQKNKTEPLIIATLVRFAQTGIGVAAVWEALEYPGWGDNALAELQRVWESMDFLTQAESALAMELAMASQTYAAGRESYSVITSGSLTGGSTGSGFAEFTQMSKDVLDNPKEGLRNLARRYPGYWYWVGWQSYDDEIANGESVQVALGAVRRARAEACCGRAFKDSDKDFEAVKKAHPQAGQWLEATGGLGSFVQNFLRRLAAIEMQRSLVVTAIALKRHHLRHGSFPAELGGLVPDFLKAVPLDPMDGAALRYRLRPDGSFLLYSAGEDGVDNQGDPTPSASLSRNRWKARDVIWPQPEPEEAVRQEFDRLTAKWKAEASRQVWPAPNSPQEREFRERYGLSIPTNPATATNSQPR